MEPPVTMDFALAMAQCQLGLRWIISKMQVMETINELSLCVRATMLNRLVMITIVCGDPSLCLTTTELVTVIIIAIPIVNTISRTQLQG